MGKLLSIKRQSHDFDVEFEDGQSASINIKPNGTITVARQPKHDRMIPSPHIILMVSDSLMIQLKHYFMRDGKTTNEPYSEATLLSDGSILKLKIKGHPFNIDQQKRYLFREED